MPTSRSTRARLPLVGLLLGYGVLGLLGFDLLVTHRLDAVLRHHEARWVRRVDHGEHLLAAGRPAAAADYLAALDEVFPARSVRHRHGRERERLLLLLARSHEALGRRGRTRAAFDALVAFDPRNHETRFLRAEAHLRLGRTDDARADLELCQQMYPAHQATMAHLVELHHGAGDWRAVAATFERYVWASRFQEVELWRGQARAAACLVPVDGRFHVLELALPAVEGAALGFTLLTGGLQAELRGAEGMPQRLAGSLRRDAPPRTATGARSEAGRLGFELPGPHVELAGLRLELRLLEPVSAACWELVRTAYRNLLRDDDLQHLGTLIGVVDR